MATKNDSDGVPQSFRNAERIKFLKKTNKKRSTRKANIKVNTKKITNPVPLKRAKKVK